MLFSIFSDAQMCVNIIDTDRVYQKRKKKFINNKYLEGINSFDELNPTCISSEDSLSYNYQYDSYVVEESINKVWQAYKTISLSDTYTGHIVSFGFLYSKNQKKLIYIDSDNYDGMNEIVYEMKKWWVESGDSIVKGIG